MDLADVLMNVTVFAYVGWLLYLLIRPDSKDEP